MKRIEADAWIDEKPSLAWTDDTDTVPDLVTSVQDDRFHIGQSYEKDACKTYTCLKCGSNQFYVGKGDYYTALKCPICKWEICIHEG